MSNIHEREEFRKTSVTAAACIAQIYGKGKDGYVEAIKLLLRGENCLKRRKMRIFKMEENNKSVEICRIALKMSISSRDEERKLMKEYKEKGIRTAAVNVGGAMPQSRFKFIESALMAAKEITLFKMCMLTMVQ